jgi:hypothetical protein
MFLTELKSFVAQHRNKGRGEAFGFDDITTEVYLRWAFTKDYLLISTGEDGVNGVAIVYPIKYSFDDPESMFCFSEAIPKEQEHLYDLCIMDMVSTGTNSTKKLVNKFKLRYPHWSVRRKWALRFGNPKLITNKYIELL